MLFNDLYIGTPPGSTYPDFVEILNFSSNISDKDIDLESSMLLDLESNVDNEVLLNARIIT